MVEVIFTLLPGIYEFEWIVNKSTFNKIEKIWKTLPETSFYNDTELFDESNYCIANLRSKCCYTIFSSLIIKRCENIFYLKNDCRKKIENTILKTVPKSLRQELLVYLNN